MIAIHILPVRYALPKLIVTFFCFAFLSCGSGSDSVETPSDTGAFNFIMAWENSKNLQRQAPQGMDICEDFLIETVEIRLRTTSGSFSTTQQWPCENHGGGIPLVPAGEELEVTVIGYIDGREDWQGKLTEISIAPGLNNPAEVVTLGYNGPDVLPPEVAPAITSSNTNVNPGATHSFAFSERVAPSTVNSTSIILVEAGLEDSPIPCNIIYDSQTAYTVAITPVDSLKTNTGYALTFSTDIMDSHGNNIKTPYYWNFTTSKEPAKVYYQDLDGDGYGNPEVSVSSPIDGYVLDYTDCNDTNPSIHPNIAELCNGVDDDCDSATSDGSSEAWMGTSCDGADTDFCPEGVFECIAGIRSCSDTSGDNFEICNGKDDDCNGKIDDGECTVIADRSLASAITEALGIPAGPISGSDLQGLTELDACGLGIVDLEGIEYCTNLKYLDLCDNQIRSIEPLAKLTRLEGLNLNDNQIESIEPLAGLEHLKVLYIWRNHVASIEPLANLISLKEIDLWLNEIESVDPLSGLINLEELCLCGNNVRSIEPLAGLTQLRGLCCRNNQITSIESLSGLTNLEKLWLSGNQIPSIESISKLTNLVDLWLDDAGIVTGTAALVSLTKAENIDLSGNAKIPCTDLDRLEAALEADVVIRPDTCQ